MIFTLDEPILVCKIARYKFAKPPSFDTNPRRPLKNKRKKDWNSLQLHILKELLEISLNAEGEYKKKKQQMRWKI